MVLIVVIVGRDDVLLFVLLSTCSSDENDTILSNGAILCAVTTILSSSEIHFDGDIVSDADVVNIVVVGGGLFDELFAVVIGIIVVFNIAVGLFNVLFFMFVAGVIVNGVIPYGVRVIGVIPRSFIWLLLLLHLFFTVCLL